MSSGGQSDVWQHVRSGRLYVIENYDARIEADLTRAVVYRSLADGEVWVRPYAEFFDGRFRNVSIDEVRPGKTVGMLTDLKEPRHGA